MVLKRTYSLRVIMVFDIHQDQKCKNNFEFWSFMNLDYIIDIEMIL